MQSIANFLKKGRERHRESEGDKMRELYIESKGGGNEGDMSQVL